MVGMVSQVVVPPKKVGEKERVFTIVCEVVDSARPHYHSAHHHNQQYEQEEEVASPLTTRLWKMASAWRVISFFLVVFVLPTVLISLPLYARYHLYHARHLPMTETDTRALNHAVSSFWCQGQRVSSNGSLDAFLVSGAPKVRKQRRHISLKRNLTLQHDDIEYWGVYLLEGSSFSVSSSARWPGGVMLVVQGEENLRKCFYRENRVEEELQNQGAVYKGPQEDELNDGKKKEMATDRKQTIMDEEHHWFEEEDVENAGGEVFDDSLPQDFDTGKERQPHQNKDTGPGNEHSLPRDKDEVDVGTEHRLSEDEDEETDAGMERPLPKAEDELSPTGDDDDDDDDDDDEPEGAHKYDLEAKLKNKRRKGRKGRKNRKKKNRDSAPQHGRIQRSAILGGNAADPSKSSLTQDAVDPMENIDINRLFNDTGLVTAGESSYSSSEEFMENCRNAILMAELTPYIAWGDHISNSDPANKSADSWTFNVNSSDYFYIIFTSDNSFERNDIGFELDLLRVTYDVSEPIETCRNSTECVFPLAFTQTEAVVVEVPAGEELLELHPFEVTTACQPRVPVYMVFILLVPFIILLFAFQ